MDEKTAWDIYFASICSFKFHPRNEGKHADQTHVDHAAMVADKMLVERRKRWDGEPQQAAPPPA